MKLIVIPIVILAFNMFRVSGLFIPSVKLVKRLVTKAAISTHPSKLLRRHSSINIVRCFSSNDQEFPGVELNVTDSAASHLFATEVSSFGLNTALAEQHIMLGNYDEAKKLAQKAIDIGDNTYVNNIKTIYILFFISQSLTVCVQERGEKYLLSLCTSDFG